MAGSRGVRFGGALVALVLAVPVAAGSVQAAAPAAPVVHAKKGTLSFSPSEYVAGQALTFVGNVGKPGRRAVRLQVHMNRPGDQWQDVPDAAFRTKASGAYRFTFPAPSMFGVSYRVAGAGVTTGTVQLDARPQEITLSLVGEGAESPFHEVVPGAAFTVVADATPAVRSTLGTPPAFAGRTISLQERAPGANTWQTIASKPADAAGEATFDLTAPASGAARVLRARQEPWTQGQDRIGWFASFPAYFTAQPPKATPGPTATRLAASASKEKATRPTASGKYQWGRAVYDFGWERGQDLDSPPSLGTREKGRWLETSDGTGRVTPFNGGLVLQSKLLHTGPGDLGTTTATLTGNAQKRGRWEFRLQGQLWESGPAPYRFLLELVPERAPLTTCAPSSVVVADFTLGGSGMGVGVRSEQAGAVWSRSVGGVRLAEQPFNVAVEVGQDHVTWFRDGKPVATTKDKGAVPGQRLVPRLSLIGQQSEMNGAQVASDWQRAYGIKAGTQVTKGAKLATSAYSATC